MGNKNKARLIIDVTRLDDDHLAIEFNGGSMTPEIGPCEMYDSLLQVSADIREAALKTGHKTCVQNSNRSFWLELKEKHGGEIFPEGKR